MCSVGLSEPTEKQDTAFPSMHEGGMMGQGAFLPSKGCENQNPSLQLSSRSSALSCFIHNKPFASHTCTHTYIHTDAPCVTHVSREKNLQLQRLISPRTHIYHKHERNSLVLKCCPQVSFFTEEKNINAYIGSSSNCREDPVIWKNDLDAV